MVAAIMFGPLAPQGHYDIDCLKPAWLEVPMFVPDVIRQSVLFLGNKDDRTGKFTPRATAFVCAIHEGGLSFRFVVTAEHNISAFAKKGWKIYLRSNLLNGGVREDSWDKAHWYYHPDIGSTDVAIAAIDFHPDEEYKAIVLRSDNPANSGKGFAGTSEVLKERDLGLGDEIFIAGLFRSHFGKQRNVPIIRVGNLAMMRGEPVNTDHCGYTDAYLVEARSIGGLSGSPVFIHTPIWRIRNGVMTPGEGTLFYLLGLMHGHFDIKNLNEEIVVDSDSDVTGGINTGIGVVIPVEKILETIDQPELVDVRKKAIREHRQKNGATADFDGDPPANNENPNHRSDFTRLVDAAARKPPQED